MSTRPLVLVHGYGSDGDAFAAWRPVLRAAGRPEPHVVDYETRSDDVGLDDLAEGFERALRHEPGLGPDRPFDAIVHSTGMLVVRAWLAARPERRARLKRLVGLAPATFGSPLAHKGRGMLGALFAGDRSLGPDFLEAGDRILSALELGSPVAWSLAERAAADGDAPFLFALCGTEGYGLPFGAIDAPGSDGVVRLAGAAPAARRVVLDLTRGVPREARVRLDGPRPAVAPLAPIEGCHHGTILHRPPPLLRDLVLAALRVEDRADYDAWAARAARLRDRLLRRRARGRRPLAWAQVVFRVRDERGGPVNDYYVELLARDAAGDLRPVREVLPSLRLGVHVHADAPSYRCFHLDLGSGDPSERGLGLRLLAHSGTDLVGYRGHHDRTRVRDARDDGGAWDGLIDLGRSRLFEPLATTLVEVRLDREPLPARGPNRLVRLRPRSEAPAAHADGPEGVPSRS